MSHVSIFVYNRKSKKLYLNQHIWYGNWQDVDLDIGTYASAGRLCLGSVCVCFIGSRRISQGKS